MSMLNLTNCSLAARAGATMLALSMSPASAFTLSGPSLGEPVASAQIEKVWWDRWGNGIGTIIALTIRAMAPTEIDVAGRASTARSIVAPDACAS